MTNINIVPPIIFPNITTNNIYTPTIPFIIPKSIKNLCENHYVYLLQSINNKNKTYIGYTVNPGRRLRQHNREIKGGANKTKYSYPWRMICYISGFPDHNTALRYEWVNNHPKMMGMPFRKSVKGRLITMVDTLTKRDRFTSKTEYYTRDLFLQWNWLVLGHKFSDFIDSSSNLYNCRNLIEVYK